MKKKRLKLTEADALEIYEALRSKQDAVETMYESAMFDIEEKESEEWLAHLAAIIEKIGEDGKNLIC